MKEKLLKLLEKRSALSKQKADLLDVAINEGRSLSEDETKKHKTLVDEIRALDDLIKLVEEQVKEEEALNANQERVIGPSASTPPTQENRNGGASESGDKPKTKAEVTNEPQTRWSSLGEFLRAVADNSRGISYDNPGAIKLRQYHKECRALMQEQVPSDGGFLLQTTYVNEIYTRVFETGVLTAKTLKLPLGNPNSNVITIPMTDESSRVDGSQYGGITADWIGEGDSITESQGKFMATDIRLHKLAAAVPITEELLSDASALGAWINNGVTSVMRFKADQAIFEGNGAGRPKGIMNSGAKIAVAKEQGQAAGTIKPENIIKMYSRAINPAKSEWFINQDVFPQLYLMSLAVGTGGAPVFMPANNMQGQPYNSLLNRPINVIEHCETLGTEGDIVFADLSEYVMIDKGSIMSSGSIHVYFLSDKQVFKFIWRLGGQPMWNKPLTPAKGSATRSPIITLANR